MVLFKVSAAFSIISYDLLTCISTRKINHIESSQCVLTWQATDLVHAKPGLEEQH